MPFNSAICTILEYHTTHAPANEDIWYGLWNSILTILFPATEGYMLAPHCLCDNSKSSIPDSIIEVVKVSLHPLALRPVLIAEIQDTQYWESGIPALQHQLNRYTDGAFSGALSGTAK
ncbi:hypothetical protein BS47DRAFT_1353380 [Hydnum rufescens UP504]|uniref:Uncharacterized protein n=1 Tax=Hydnum rufescens UP504 TaxID=1448309 RepID=A0A9P6AHN5_9AGAM|nr:hypothetical protein BS47DRAFT_1353380 [Hydnum rufescens UP504]